MPSSLLNSPYPNISIRDDDTPFSRGSDAYRERELKARRMYLARAAKGDRDAQLLLKAHWKLTRWWKREKGEVL